MLGVMSIMSYAELFDDLITGKLTQSYEDSYDFDTELMNSAYQVMSGIDSEQMFETDGKIDEDKLVDIQVYNNSETISGQNESGLSYRLGDLLNWYQKLIYSESTSYVGDTLTDSAELEGNDAEDLKAPIVCKLSDGSYHYYSQDDFNEKVEIINNSKGITYITGGSCTGSKFYKSTNNKSNYVKFKYDEENPIYTIINVSKDKIIIKTYKVNSDEMIDSKIIINK